MIPGVKGGLLIVGAAVAALATLAILLTFERPPVEVVQRGFRGTAIEQNYDPRMAQAYLAANVAPKSLPQLPASGPKAGAVYKNVQVLGDLSVGQFTRLMASITAWVEPQAGCAGCHNTANMAEDNLYTKIVARRMIQMTRHINADWQPHVQQTGVVCWTCHRGNPVPSNVWFEQPPSKFSGMAETNTGAGFATAAVNYSSLPMDPFTPYLQGDHPIRVQSEQTLPGTDSHSIKETEWTYALMIHFAQSLGVNCTYCHNSRAFGDWSQSSPQRVVAWHGTHMVRDLNNEYLNPLRVVFPANRLGPVGDSPKVNCATCHQGVFKPLYGVSMLQAFPELAGPGTGTMAAN